MLMLTSVVLIGSWFVMHLEIPRWIPALLALMTSPIDNNPPDCPPIWRFEKLSVRQFPEPPTLFSRYVDYRPSRLINHRFCLPLCTATRRKA